MQLRLTLYAKYFYKILDGSKKIEYRKLSDYYKKKFDKNNYETILFINGYGNKRPFMVVKLNKIIKIKDYYELHLGNVLEVGNIKQNDNLFYID
jgi:hypothetical protein